MTTPIASSFGAATVSFTRQLCPWSGSNDPSYSRSWWAALKRRVVVISKGIGDRASVWRVPPASLESAGMRRYFPDLESFTATAKAGAEIVPVYRQLLADRLTPVTAFEVLGRDPHAFLLESVVGGEQVARHSFIASSPSLVYTAFMGKASIAQRMHRPKEFDTADPL